MAKNHIAEMEKRLWDVADELRANSDLKSSEYYTPVLGLIFLRYADYRFTEQEKILSKKTTDRRKIGKTDYQAARVMYLPKEARFSHLLNLPEGANIGGAINEAMTAIEKENEDLRGVLPKTYNRFKNNLLAELLRLMSSIPTDIDGDAFGKIYEYFLGKFAMAEGQQGGEFFTPTSIVKLIVSVIQPFQGKIFDPACGSGGMFVQSAEFIERHKKRAVDEISIYGQEKTRETVNLCKMNLAVHGLSGDVLQANSYYEDLHDMVGKFNYVMANPPFNVNRVGKVLFIDARKIYQQIDRAHREYLPEQIEFIANIVRLYRGEDIETVHGSEKLIEETFPTGKYQDVTGLCKVASMKEIEEQGWSLNPGRYIGVTEKGESESDFKERL